MNILSVLVLQLYVLPTQATPTPRCPTPNSLLSNQFSEFILTIGGAILGIMPTVGILMILIAGLLACVLIITKSGMFWLKVAAWPALIVIGIVLLIVLFTLVFDLVVGLC